MTEILLPTWVKKTRVELRYIDNTGVSRGTFGGITRTAALGGDHLAATLDFTPTITSNVESEIHRAALISFLMELQGRQNRARLGNPARSLRPGSLFPAAELLTNNTFADGTTDWTSSASFSGSVTEREFRALSLSDPGASANALIHSATTTVANFPIIFRAFVKRGPYTTSLAAIIRDASSATLVSGTSSTESRMLWVVYNGAQTSVRVSVTDIDDGTRLAGDYADILYTSLSRCALVAGADQTGSSLAIDGLPVSTSGLLLKGDEVEIVTDVVNSGEDYIGSELKIVTAPLNSNSSGAGVLQFRPPLRATPDDNAPVVIHEPMGRFIFTGESAGFDNEPGIITRCSASFEEA